MSLITMSMFRCLNEMLTHGGPQLHCRRVEVPLPRAASYESVPRDGERFSCAATADTCCQPATGCTTVSPVAAMVVDQVHFVMFV